MWSQDFGYQDVVRLTEAAVLKKLGTRDNCTLVPTDKLKEMQAEVKRLRAALITSQTWLYGHGNAEGQAERRRLNAEIIDTYAKGQRGAEAPEESAAGSTSARPTC